MKGMVKGMLKLPSRQSARAFLAAFCVTLILVVTVTAIVYVQQKSESSGFAEPPPLFQLNLQGIPELILLGESRVPDNHILNRAAEIRQRIYYYLPAQFRLAEQGFLLARDGLRRLENLRREQDYLYYTSESSVPE